MKTKKAAVEKLTVGLDLGDRRHHACVLDAAGEIVAEEVIVNTREVLTAFCARYPGATIVMETGTHSPWVSRLVAAQGHPVIVANSWLHSTGAYRWGAGTAQGGDEDQRGAEPRGHVINRDKTAVKSGASAWASHRERICGVAMRTGAALRIPAQKGRKKDSKRTQEQR